MTEWDKLYLEICYLCLRINRETEYAVFFDMRGHVGWTDIRIANSKSDYNTYAATSEVIHVEREYASLTDIDRLTKIRDRLKNILVSREIDYGDLTPIEVLVTEYEL